ncbi:tripartite tricarboxylate transporter permease [Treponema parvum]|uniref:Tripartite tricarboxylate transporter permease n=1 Tax=Treponema parvum TaxID=138851 RepID=A0A975F5Z0_9SPIR|nr:tripartite tricarboxylate transporter permease [Treponema parvum]QTQ14965.1 tripartite tricarboxylate transporter permease [Treponema parvum]
MLFSSFINLFANPLALVLIVFGVMFGIVFGALPGLTTVAGISMMLPVTYVLTKEAGLSMLTAIYIGGTSGGLVSAILLNMPGTPASIATCFDGRPMALKGEAGKALGIGIFASFFGTIFSIAAMVVISKPLAALTIKFGPWEYFGVTLFALTLIASLAGKSMIKGLLSALFGMMFATVGLAPIDSAKRFTFDTLELTSGFALLPVLVGLYAVSEVLETVIEEHKDATMTEYRLKGLGFGWNDIKDQIGNLVRSAVVGLGIGVLPGIGGSTSNLIAYSVAKNSSKHPEKFGTGIVDGIIASETSNNASIGGAMIPLLTLGIPGDGVTAILLGGFMLHGLTPGPLLFQTNADTVYAIYAAMILSSAVMAIVMFTGLRGFVKILKIPSYILLPVIIVLCGIGSYALNYRVFDIFSLLLFGIMGYVMKKVSVPLPPFILGFILAKDFETNLRRGLQYANGNTMEIFSHPIAILFIALAVFSIVRAVIKGVKNRSGTAA